MRTNSCCKLITLIMVMLCSCNSLKKSAIKEKNISFSGIYPHLAYYNNENECGTGAVVPWADRLWVITYGPHQPFGSSDKLYEITPALNQIIRPESIGGTPANRLIHKESHQLVIGPYFIDTNRNVRVIRTEVAPGRFTGSARHLTDPANKIYTATMEEGFYQIDVNSLKVDTLYEDGNTLRLKTKTKEFSELLPGAHGKGLYSGQGVLVYSNNGDGDKRAYSEFDVPSGVLAEWNGKDWKVVRRNQFVEVTGPGGLYGNANPATDPIWATGWDHRSILLASRDKDAGWSFFRLPKASHSYDGAHGWNTEWPRIRNVGTSEKPDYLMTMHGMFWSFPSTFSINNTSGIRPQSAYLKVIGDFTRWNNRLVFGCDDAAKNEFLNKRTVKGGIPAPGQSNSNLWFTALDQTKNLGPNTAEGAVWISEKVESDKPSDPFLFAGWKYRTAWILNEGKNNVVVRFDTNGGGKTWSFLKSVEVKSGESAEVLFNADEDGEWIRATPDQSTVLTVHFSYTDRSHFSKINSSLFAGIQNIEKDNYTGGLLYSLGDNKRSLGILTGSINNHTFKENGYYELNEQMKLIKKEDAVNAAFLREKLQIPKDVVSVDKGSVLIVDDKNRRWRLPLGNKVYTASINAGVLRLCREVSTERDLFDAHGTFYELPAENADGFAKIRPIASHNFAVHDYASYRGMLILTGIQTSKTSNSHIITSSDGKAKVWAGVIDDLWKLGKPVGEGGPWINSPVKQGEKSDPYLIGFYDKRSLKISHNSSESVTFKVEVNPIGHGPWMTYMTVTIKPGEMYTYTFPDSFQARWIRFSSDKECLATTWLSYK